MKKTLKELRAAYGMTQDQLANHLGISTQNLRNYESGAYMKMRSDLEEEISKLFKVDFKYIKEDYIK
ncbi:MAG: helix-turn-helix transcriptional regulator [Clostridium sp.]|uniref:helix-turn-helix transcriptional regulator n=1 Tax=Clostridium sp. TaxID=1506 RepID=UPI003EE539C9